jgi:hypothetical protein
MRRTVEKPPCRDYATFLKTHLGKDCLAPLTGQDARALHAFLHAVQLWGNSDGWGRRHAETAMRALVLAMQSTTRHLAKRAIPRVLDWGHEAEIWGRLFPDGEPKEEDCGTCHASGWINVDEKAREERRAPARCPDCKGERFVLRAVNSAPAPESR